MHSDVQAVNNYIASRLAPQTPEATQDPLSGRIKAMVALLSRIRHVSGDEANAVRGSWETVFADEHWRVTDNPTRRSTIVVARNITIRVGQELPTAPADIAGIWTVDEQAGLHVAAAQALALGLNLIAAANGLDSGGPA